MIPGFPRRRFLAAGASALALGACSRWSSPAPEHGPIAAMFPGRIDDGGFIEAGYRGLMRVRDDVGIPVSYVDDVAPEAEAMKDVLRRLARSDAKMVIAYGGQTSEAVQRVAWEFPQQRFTVIQGFLTRPNLAIYEVLQEQSAWLAGAAAGMLTKTNVVGHMSGLRVRPGLKARAAFADGLATTNPRAKLLTNFSGTQDDAGLAKRIAFAQIDAGADIIFTMLNAGRAGAIEACRERGVKQIGNVRDWVAVMPDVFVASAVADGGVAIVQVARDLHDSLWKGDLVKRIGIRNRDAVRLALAPTVPEAVKVRIAAFTQEMVAGSIKIPEEYSGPEFAPA
jgi:basic membrane protein A and related proteins